MLFSPAMRIGVVLLLLVGCAAAEREQSDLEPLVQIGSISCSIAGAQIIIDSTYDVRLAEPGQTFRVEHVAAIGSARTSYPTYGCNEWTKMDGGCTRAVEAQPELQPVSLHVTDNVTGVLPDLVRVEISGIVETDELVVQASRTLHCAR